MYESQYHYPTNTITSRLVSQWCAVLRDNSSGDVLDLIIYEMPLGFLIGSGIASVDIL